MSEKTMRSLYPELKSKRKHEDFFEFLYDNPFGLEPHVGGKVPAKSACGFQNPSEAANIVKINFVATEWQQSLRLAGLRSQNPPMHIGLSKFAGFIQNQISDLQTTLLEMHGKLSSVKQLVQEKEDEQQPFTVWLATLSPKPFELTRNIPVLVEPVYPEDEEEGDCGYVATFVEANVGASGDTLEEAVNNLKDRMASVYRKLEKQNNAGKIGRSLLNNFKVLKSVMARIDDGEKE